MLKKQIIREKGSYDRSSICYRLITSRKTRGFTLWSNHYTCASRSFIPWYKFEAVYLARLVL
jgi:hypothetical protein